MKIITILGARPQFIKAAAVSRCLAEQPGREDVLVHTGQHFEAAMSAVFFEELGLPRPRVELGIHGGTPDEQRARMQKALIPVLADERPDVVLVYGDTNSTLAGARAADAAGIPVAHVEAGLRSYVPDMPEEFNRVQTDRLARILFCPHVSAAENLRKEGIFTGNPAGQQVLTVGDVMLDVFLAGQQRVDAARLEPWGLAPGTYALATVHRAVNTDTPAAVREAFAVLAAAAERMPVVLPLHPRLRERLQAFELSVPSGVAVLPPVTYLDMMTLLCHARLVLTDSGGMQKEALWAGKPCVTLREETEWTETVAAGFNVLISRDPQRLAAAWDRVETMDFSSSAYTQTRSLFGDGKAAERICAAFQQG